MTLLPVVSGLTRPRPNFGEAVDFDLALLEQATRDGHPLELVYRPTVH